MSPPSSWIDTYQPNRLVKLMHEFPHLNSAFQSLSNEFGIEYGQPFVNRYTESIMVLPILVGAIGLVSIIIFQISISCRSLFHFCKCTPSAAGKFPT